MRLVIACALALLPSLQAQRPGEEVDLALFGRAALFDGHPGIEWDEPRIVRRVTVEGLAAPPAGIAIEYWVSNWPAAPSGGWTKTDTRWQGEWRRVTAAASVGANALTFEFGPLTESENANARNVPGYAPSFRKTLKLRLRAVGSAPAFKALHAYGESRWNVRTLVVEPGCEGKEAPPVSASAYNGRILRDGSRMEVLYTEHPPGSADATILTLRAGSNAFGVAVDDVIREKAVYVRPLGIFVGDDASGARFARFLESGCIRTGQDVISRISREPEQTLARASGEIPSLALTARSGAHPLRYYPLGFPGSREKYGLDFNGNVFISKHSSKAMKEDLARMLWEGDQIYFRFGTGATPDFREREHAARQTLRDGWLPLVTTRWTSDGIEYEEQAYSTLLSAPLDDAQLRGDEPSVLLLKLATRNPGEARTAVRVRLEIRPGENLQWADRRLIAAGNGGGAYAHPRMRAALDPGEGTIGVTDRGTAVWSIDLPPGETRALVVKIPFRTMESPEDQRLVTNMGFGDRLEETLAYWSRLQRLGMSIRVPDQELNRFYVAVLQHILVTVEKDVKTGYDMCPCGTYDYNMFANETAIQVRLLDMRGLSTWAWRCLRPIVELQGSKPFPGRFQDTSAVFHGVRVDADHDYTHSGYNLNHGWILWTLAEHYLFTRDEPWLKSVLPRMTQAAEWIVRERRATMRHDSAGAPVPEYGLLPAGQLEDNEDFEYWFAVNAYAYRGLRAAAGAIATLDAEAGRRIAQEAEAYRKDIRSAALHAMAISPAVPLRDGTFVPHIPPRTSLHGRDLGWIRNILYGARTLIDCGIFSPDEPAATWILQDYEDTLFMSEDSMAVPDRDWFSRGGITLQPNLVNTFVSYLERDQIPHALRSFYNTFAVSYYPDVAAFTEWVPSLGTSGGPFFKTSDEAAFLTWLRLMLVREDGDVLYLSAGAPRKWFEAGKKIEVKDCPTFLGKIGFEVESHADEGRMDAFVQLSNDFRGKALQLRLRHPERKTIVRVEVDGSAWNAFDSARELIAVPVTPGRHEVRAYF